MRITARAERKRERRRILIALAISVVFHLLLVLVAVVLIIAFTLANPTPPPPEPIELTILPPEPPPEPKKEKDFLDSSQLEVAEEAPKDAQVESDQNARAASEGPAVGELPIPTVDGKKDEGSALREQQVTLGPQDVASPQAPPPRPQAEPQTPTELAKLEQRPESTPTPLPTPAEDDLAVPEPPKSKEQPEVEVRKPELPAPPTLPRKPGYQPQTQPTRLTGGITNRGRASRDAVATPLGRYKKAVSDAIGSRWYYYVSDMIGMLQKGTAKITFVVQRDGKTGNIRVVRNTSNQSLANCSIRAIFESEIPPIPEDIATSLEGERLEFEFTFTIE